MLLLLPLLLPDHTRSELGPVDGRAAFLLLLLLVPLVAHEEACSLLVHRDVLVALALREVVDVTVVPGVAVAGHLRELLCHPFDGGILVGAATPVGLLVVLGSFGLVVLLLGRLPLFRRLLFAGLWRQLLG